MSSNTTGNTAHWQGSGFDQWKRNNSVKYKWKWSKMASLLTGKMAWVEDKSEKTFFLDKVDGIVKLTKTVEIPQFSTIQVHGMTKVKGHDKRINLIV